jgi:hypothetical protein
VLVAGLVLSGIGPMLASAEECVETVLLGRACTEANGIGWYYSASERAFFSTPGSFEAGSNRPNVEWSYVPACDGNGPAGGTAGLCTGALCTAPTGEPGVQFWQFSRRLNPPNSPWTLEGTQCLAGERRVDMADIDAEVRRIIESRFREIAAPSITMAPAQAGLVNLPVLAWTAQSDDVTLDIEQPLPGRIAASPRYEWVWSNGDTADGAGRTYSPDVSPSTNLDAYVATTYSSPGQAVVTLTVTWTGDVTVPGIPPVEIDPLVYSSSASLPVREARSVLVDGSR